MWISCSRELPPTGKIVLVTDGDQVGPGFLCCDWHFESGKTKSKFVRPVALDPLEGIIAWRKLPSPPGKWEKKCLRIWWRIKSKIYS